MEQSEIDSALLAAATETLAEPVRTLPPAPPQGETQAETAEEPAQEPAQDPDGTLTEQPKEKPAPKYGEFGDDPSKFVESYKHLRGWTTRASQENARLKAELAALQGPHPQPATPEDPDLEGIDPEARKLLDKYLEKKIAPLTHTIAAMHAGARENAVQRHHQEQLNTIQKEHPTLYTDPVVVEAFRAVLQERPFLIQAPGGVELAFLKAAQIAGKRPDLSGPSPAPQAQQAPLSETPPATIQGKAGGPAAPRGPTFDQLIKDAAADGPRSDKWGKVMEFHMRRSGMI